MDFLEHYGVKGMQWGKRKARDEGARRERFAPKAGKKKQAPSPSVDAINREIVQRKAKKHGLDTVSNNELKVAIDRMNLEVNYSRLTEQTRKKGKGERFVNFLMKDVAEVQVKRVITNEASIQVENAIRDRGRGDLADRMKPKKK